MEPTKELQLTINIQRNGAELARVREEIGSLLKQAQLSSKLVSMLVLAVDEALSAIIHYNRDKGFGHTVTTTVDVNEVRFKACVVDPVTDFGGPPTYEQLHGDRKYKISFYLMTKVMDEVSYSYKRGFENRLELVKFL
jgi:anti-sigma regulatory factor (Ser/Thr protein kinase)